MLAGNAAAGAPAGTGNAQDSMERTCAARLFDDAMQTFGFPGLAVAVQRRGVPLFVASDGPVHLNYSRKITPADRFQVSSTAKVFAGVLLGMLIDRGSLDPDDSARRYIPELPPAFEPLKVKHAFENTGMLVRMEQIPGSLDGSAARADVLAAVIESGFVGGVPGDAFNYGDASFFIAQLILENVTGLAYDDAVRTMIFEPAGMLDSGFHSDYRTPLRNAVTEYYPDGNGGYEMRDYVFPYYLHAAGGIATTTIDLLRFDRSLLSGELVSRKTLDDEIWKESRLNDGRLMSYARGWDPKDHAPGQFSVGHNGGYLSTYRFYWQHDLSVIILASGYLQDWNPDDLATAFAAVWAPAIVGLEQSQCSFDALLGDKALF